METQEASRRKHYTGHGVTESGQTAGGGGSAQVRITPTAWALTPQHMVPNCPMMLFGISLPATHPRLSRRCLRGSFAP